MNELEWSEPSGRDWQAIADQLRANPMKWAKIYTQDRHSYASSIFQGSNRAMHKDNGIEVRTRNTTWRDGVRYCDLFARYNPGKEKSLRRLIEERRSDGSA